MSAQSVLIAVREKLKSALPLLENRVFILSSTRAFFNVQNFGLPGVGLLYGGGPPIHEKGIEIPQYEYYSIEMHMFDSVPIEETVVLGDETRDGLLDWMDTIKGVMLPYFPTGVISVRVTNKLGITDWVSTADEGLAASTGLVFEYLDKLT